MDVYGKLDLKENNNLENADDLDFNGNILEKSKDIQEIKKIDVTASSSSVSFSTLSLSTCSAIHFINEGDTDCYFSFSGTATTNDVFIPSGRTIEFTNLSFTTFSAITSTGTTTLKIIGLGKTGGNYSGNSQVYEIENISVTASSSSVSFSTLTSPRDILVQNTGATDCYFSMSGTATLNDILIESGSSKILENVNQTTFSAITSTGTTTLNILGIGN